MKVSKFIETLKKYKKEYGDFEVVLSADNEGNSYGSTSTNSFGVCSKKLGDNSNAIVIYPNYEAEYIEECVDYWEEK